MRGHIYRKGDTNYIRYELPRGLDGARRQKAIACPGLTRRQVEAKLRGILTALDSGTYARPTRITVGDYMRQWLARGSREWSPTTLCGYSINTMNHIMPKIGDVLLPSLRPSHIREMLDALAQSGLANKTVCM